MYQVTYGSNGTSSEVLHGVGLAVCCNRHIIDHWDELENFEWKSCKFLMQNSLWACFDIKISFLFNGMIAEGLKVIY